MTCLAPKSRILSVIRKAVLACGSVALVLAAVQPSALYAQDQTFRTVDGKVVDKQNAPLKGAVVYLKDGHTLAVKSYIAGDDGSYRFGQLSSTTDYTLWAEAGGKKSSNRSISSFDSRNKFDITLKVDK